MKNFTWMLRFGVPISDVLWLAGVYGTPEIYERENTDRAFWMYETAIGGILTSAHPVGELCKIGSGVNA